MNRSLLMTALPLFTCAQAKRRQLDAQTEAEVNSAVMVMNILCQD
jgi:hypothetical protein